MALYRYKFTEQQNFKEETGKSMLNVIQWQNSKGKGK